MKNRIIVSLIALASLTIALFACSGGGGGGGGGNTPAGDTGTNTGGDQYGSGPDPVSDPTGNPTSYDLINAARNAGTLTTEQALIYKMYVDFNDPALPAQYKGDDTGLIEGDSQQQVVSYINSVGAANVSTATLNALWPFFVPAYYEGSWWHKQHPNASAPALRTAARAPSPNCRPWETGCSKLSNWNNVAGAHVVIWYETARETVDGPRANILMHEFETAIWPKLTALMGRTPMSDAGTGLISETDGRLDVLLVDMPADKEGATFPSSLMGCKAVPAYIYLNRNLSMQGLEAQGAHEFMHALQFTYDVASSCVNDYYTTLEATAVWATNYVYPTNDWEHKYPKSYLLGSRVSIAYDDRSAPDAFRYGAYLLPLFLETRFSASIVKEIWDKTLTYHQELDAIDSALVARGSAFDKEWPKFVAANWNRDTIDTYLKLDRLTEAAELKIDDTFTMDPSGVRSLKHAVDLPHASSAYYRVAFGDTASRSVTLVNGLSFKADVQDPSGFGNALVFTGLSALDRAGASMQVLLKVNGVWQSAPINMTNVMWLTVCRDDPAGRIDEVIFMYANAEINSTTANYTHLVPRLQPPGVLVTNIGCRDWTGSISMMKPLTGGQETLTISDIVLKNAMPTAAPLPGGEPGEYPIAAGDQVPLPPGYVYSIFSGSATWSYNATPAGCTNTGSKTLAISNPAPTHTFSNWTPPGPAAHGLFLTGFLGLAPLQFNYDWRCVDTLGHVTTGTTNAPTMLDVTTLINDPGVRISAGTGLAISGTGAQTGDPAHATGTWSFVGATN